MTDKGQSRRNRGERRQKGRRGRTRDGEASRGGGIQIKDRKTEGERGGRGETGEGEQTQQELEKQREAR